MKVTKVNSDGVTIFPSVAMAASDAGLSRSTLSRRLSKYSEVTIGDNVYSIPIEYKTKRHERI